MRIENSARGSLFGITSLRRVMPFGITSLRRVMLNSDPEGRIFPSAPKNHDRFFLHIFWTPAFDFSIGVAINESRWRPPYWKLTSYVTLCDVVMMSTPNVLATELRDFLYNQCIDNACCYSLFIYPTGRIRVCKKRFVSTGENREKPFLAYRTHPWKILIFYHTLPVFPWTQPGLGNIVLHEGL